MSWCYPARTKQTRLKHCLKTCFFSFVLFTNQVFSAPGAHGPNGEHLDSETRQFSSRVPKFEAFTETFELVGKVTETQVQIHLHDYATNKPVVGANIELETNGKGFSAQYDALKKHYVLSDEALLKRFSEPGEHEVILTLFTEDAADLMATTLVIEALPHAEHEEHNHHFPWWAVGLGLLTFGLGLATGRITKKEGRR